VPHLSDDGYLCFRSGNIRALVSAEHPEVRALLDSIDRFFADGAVILKDGRSVKAARIEVPDSGTFFLKRYNNKGFIYSLRYIFRRPRPWRVKIISDRLREAGIHTPKIIAAAVRRKWGIFLDTSYVMTEFLENLIAPEKLVPQLLKDRQLFAEYCDQVISALNHLHDNGLLHGDLKIANIYCRRGANGQLEVGLLDLDSTVHFSRRLKTKERTKDLSRFIASLLQTAEALKLEIEKKQLVDFIISEYEKLSAYELNEASLMKMIRIHMERYRRKYANG